MSTQTLKILSQNVRGLRDDRKRQQLFRYLKNSDVTFFSSRKHIQGLKMKLLGHDSGVIIFISRMVPTNQEG